MSKPQRIPMLAFPDCQMLDVTGPLQMFAGVNDELGRQAYELVIAAPKRALAKNLPKRSSSVLNMIPHLRSRRDTRIGPPHRHRARCPSIRKEVRGLSRGSAAMRHEAALFRMGRTPHASVLPGSE
jgi:transcriptional regulator GlxA family with amidase domain